MNHAGWCIVAVMAMGVAGTARGEFWGAQADSSLGDIRASGGQSNFTFDSDGGQGDTSASVMIDDAVTTDSTGQGPWDRGDTSGLVVINPATGNPAVHKNEAYLTGNTANVFNFGSFPNGATDFSGTFSSELFEYTGDSPTTLSITFLLEGVVDDPVSGTTSDNTLTGLFAQVAVFTPDNYDFFSDLGTLIGEFGAVLESSGGDDAVDNSTLTIDDDTGGLVEQRMVTLDFDVEPGDEFYVWQTMVARAQRGSRSADGFSSLTSSFGPSSEVENLSPEPASLALLGLGAVALIRRR